MLIWMRFSAESVFFFLSRCNTHAFTIEGASPQTWKTLLLYLDIDSIQGHFQRHNYKLQITKTKFHPSKISNYLMMILHNLQQVTKLRPNLLGLFVSFYWFHWRRQWHPTPVLLPRKSHVQRRLVGCSPWGCQSRTRLSDFTFTFHFHALEKEAAGHSSVLAWRIPGTGEPRGLPSMGSHRVGHDWSDLAAAAAAALVSFRICETISNISTHIKWMNSGFPSAIIDLHYPWNKDVAG